MTHYWGCCYCTSETPCGEKPRGSPVVPTLPRLREALVGDRKHFKPTNSNGRGHDREECQKASSSVGCSSSLRLAPASRRHQRREERGSPAMGFSPDGLMEPCWNKRTIHDASCQGFSPPAGGAASIPLHACRGLPPRMVKYTTCLIFANRRWP
jgi:hypothetical protein